MLQCKPHTKLQNRNFCGENNAHTTPCQRYTTSSISIVSDNWHDVQTSFTKTFKASHTIVVARPMSWPSSDMGPKAPCVGT